MANRGTGEDSRNTQASGDHDPVVGEAAKRRFCCQPASTQIAFTGAVTGERLRAIVTNHNTWAADTVLTYWFFDDAAGRPAWVGAAADVDAVRSAFAEWKALGIGLDFREVDRAGDATLRIGFDQSEGSWSFVGRDNLRHRSPGERTINFGWPLTDAYGHDTALHEIGHALGLEHEHQNPNSGIVWNREKVLAYFSDAPNRWSPETIQTNILNKLAPRSVGGSQWDRDSVMHYRFEAGLIDVPTEYRDRPLIPAGGLSDLDTAWVRTFYPVRDASRFRRLEPRRSEIVAAAYPGQADFTIVPPATRGYDLRLFGSGDAVMVLDELTPDGAHFLAGDDDTGSDDNAELHVRLEAGKTYRLRVKVHYVAPPDELSVMLW